MTQTEELKVGDKIDIGKNYTTILDKIEYCPFAKIDLYLFYTDKNEYKFNVKEFIKKI